ncbi:putative Fis family transcriptional regulator [Frankia canadensis]|uniref:Putative Fis family transcriptional regulator n=1 Tax=Frankia canadensis TaxID=1836972 RepID=A0A2I2KXM0_9ACTN|nr:helix-turn-helix domain-containing protein [Frankia canadensis]SNQ50414.1 putative Fis family transcriptional regulator [Frankia canadensis]SOU57704.1 putative Fis family transcriptional regulator [Frankia canadensis]
MLDDQARAVYRSRERFLGSGGDVERLPGVRADILASWRRSLGYGLEPERSRPTYAEPGEAEQLIRATQAVTETRRHHLADTTASICLTDHTGRLLLRYVEHVGFRRRLDHHDVLPGFSFAERTIGTNSGGMVLETGRPALIAGPEHFFAESLQLTCVGAPIRHPLTRRIIGTIDLTCAHDQTSPLLLAWVCELAAEIERNLTGAMSTHEQALLAAYLRANHDNGQAVVCLDERTIVTNAKASRMLGPQDQALLWERAGRWVRQGGGGAGTDRLVLSDGSAVSMSTEAVVDGGIAVGALVRLRARATAPPCAGVDALPATSTVADLPDLVGRSAAWTALRRRLAGVEAGRVVLLGERGSGKSVIARAWLAGRGITDLRVVDLAATPAGGAGAVGAPGGWAAGLRTAIAAADGDDRAAVLLRHVQHVGEGEQPVLAGALDFARERGVTVVATCTQQPSAAETPALDLFDVTVDVPALADRTDDIAPLLEELTWRATGGLRRQRWTSEAVQIVTRATWPANVAGLEALVRAVAAGPATERVTAAALPAVIRARAARRPLHGLERVEAQALMEALARANGNKKAAADALGIARSTLYRKVRALGLDLSGHTF